MKIYINPNVGNMKLNVEYTDYVKRWHLNSFASFQSFFYSVFFPNACTQKAMIL